MEHTTRLCDLLVELTMNGEGDSLVAVNKLDEDGDVEWGYTQTVEELWAQLTGRKAQGDMEGESFPMLVKRLESTPDINPDEPWVSLIEVDI